MFSKQALAGPGKSESDILYVLHPVMVLAGPEVLKHQILHLQK